MNTTPRQPRSLGGGLLNAAKRAWPFRFIVDAATVDGWRPALVRIFAMWLAAAAFYMAARVCLWIMPSLAESDVAVILYRTEGAFLCVLAIVSPAVCAATFRLRARRGFRSAVITAVLYAPIFVLAAGAVSAATALFWGADDVLSQSQVADWMSFALVMGPAFSALTALGVRIGKPPAPPPAIVSSRFYAPMEIAVSIAALAIIVSIPILAA